MEQYEFVNKTEYGPVRAELETILQKMRNYIRKNNPDLEFNWELIGSGRKHLITRVKNGNRGFDFDFNLIIDDPGDGNKWIGKNVHNAFLEAIRYAVKDTGFKDPEESTSVFTIKRVNKKQSKVNCSCDFGIVYYDNQGGYHYLNYFKENGGFGFLERSFRYDVDDAVDELTNYDTNSWNRIRAVYLELKNNNPQNKRSFILYVEAVHIVYDQVFNSPSEDDDDYDDYDDDD